MIRKKWIAETLKVGNRFQRVTYRARVCRDWETKTCPHTHVKINTAMEYAKKEALRLNKGEG